MLVGWGAPVSGTKAVLISRIQQQQGQARP